MQFGFALRYYGQRVPVQSRTHTDTARHFLKAQHTATEVPADFLFSLGVKSKEVFFILSFPYFFITCH